MSDQEGIPTNPIPEMLPQTIPDLYQMLSARLDDVAATAEHNARERYVDLRGRIDGLDQRLSAVEQRLEKVEKRLEGVERKLSDLDRKLDAHIKDLIYTKERVSDLEEQRQLKH